jgi:SH3-like domain-containing protein
MVVKFITKKSLKKINENKMKKFFISFFALVFFFSQPVLAVQKIQETNYYSSLRASETNVRAGPGQNYPIKFTYKIKSIPVRVINEYDNWNEIEDYEKQTGWVNQSLLTKKRMLMVRTTKESVNMYNKSKEKSRILFRLKNNVIGEYIKCVDDWCAMKINNKKGWVKRAELYGTEDTEKEKKPEKEEKLEE